jgi:hypothetical protein
MKAQNIVYIGLIITAIGIMTITVDPLKIETVDEIRDVLLKDPSVYRYVMNEADRTLYNYDKVFVIDMVTYIYATPLQSNTVQELRNTYGDDVLMENITELVNEFRIINFFYFR